ncbi:MAG: hypothetical protein O3C28_00720 [Proteobacteria bacterium]|nr:hypothetical protein [Pseudomonadota bacterium]
MATNQRSVELPRGLYLWAVPVPLVVHLCVRQFDSQDVLFSRWIESEAGFVENATVLLLLPAAYFAFVVALRCYRRFGPMLCVWFICVAGLCFGFAGEEVSWGQHWLGWQSSEFFIEHNRQGETNLHNINIHFGRVVKSILTLAIIIGGIIMPCRQVKSARSHGFWATATPTLVCVPAAIFVFGIRLVERFKTWFDLEWGFLAVNLKESQELYIAIFLFLYTWSAYRRFATNRNT